MKTLIMGVLLSTVLSGCQSMPTMPVARAAVAAPLGPPLEVGYCIDTTASVGHALTAHDRQQRPAKSARLKAVSGHPHPALGHGGWG